VQPTPTDWPEMQVQIWWVDNLDDFESLASKGLLVIHTAERKPIMEAWEGGAFQRVLLTLKTLQPDAMVYKASANGRIVFETPSNNFQREYEVGPWSEVPWSEMPPGRRDWLISRVAT